MVPEHMGPGTGPAKRALNVAPGVVLWPEYFDRPAQGCLLATVLALEKRAPFHRPTMPGSGRPFSVLQTNFGPLGWVSDKAGYRYQAHHPLTGAPWPPIPAILLDLWRQTAGMAAPPHCCLVNLYRPGARMGLHQDKDETATEAPVVSVSLGAPALFRIGGTSRRGPSRSLVLAPGAVVMFGGPARLAFHGIDRLLPGPAPLIPGGGRINLTLRKVY